jgi:molecular chaperone GrpE
MEEKEVKNTTPEEQNAENLSNVDDTAEINETVEGTEISQQLYEMSKIKEELQEQKDKYLRLYAEFDNFRRRSAKERIEYTQTAGQEVIKSLLEVLDDCSRAEKQMYKTEDPTIIREGLQLVFHKLRNTLISKGVKEMETIGNAFDADFHEAITEIPAPNQDMVGKVIDEVEKGYYLNDKIIRYAKVVIGK